MPIPEPDRTTARRIAAALLLALCVAACTGRERDTPPPSYPEAPDWLLARGRLQQAGAATTVARHDFTFTDRLEASGIRFVHRIVDDAGRRYKAVHYDHGTAVAAADVDGDGHLDLYFVSQLGRSELWRGRGNGTFEDATVAAGLAVDDPVGVGASFADVDNDGDADLFVTTVRKGNRLYENDGTGRFTDITAAAGLGYQGHASGAVFFDYDRDGRLDLYVANVGRYTTDTVGTGGAHVGMDGAFFAHVLPARREDGVLYHNLGGNRFQDVTRVVGLGDDGWSGEAVPLDVDGDGWLDLYLANMQGEDRLYRNREGRRFEDASARYVPRSPFGSMGVEVLDWNGDGRLDLFVTDMHSDMFDDLAPDDVMGEGRKSDPTKMPPPLFPRGTDRLLFGNALFTARDTAGGGFEESSDRAGVESYWPWGPSADDLNADGWDDLVITAGMNYPFRYAPNTVFLNEAGKRFLPAEFLLGVEPRARGATEQPWFSIDCGVGGADVGTPACTACDRPNGALGRCRTEPGTGRQTVMGTRGSRSSVIADLDEDGDLDLVLAEFNAAPQILMSDLSERGGARTLQIRLVGTRSNRDGLGAVVRLTRSDGLVLTKPMDGKSGYLGQSRLPLTFGLGATATVQGIEVRWPSGARQVVPPPTAPGRFTITEP